MSQIHILDLNSNRFLETLSEGEITSICGGITTAESIGIGLGALGLGAAIIAVAGATPGLLVVGAVAELGFWGGFGVGGGLRFLEHPMME